MCLSYLSPRSAGLLDLDPVPRFFEAMAWDAGRESILPTLLPYLGDKPSSFWTALLGAMAWDGSRENVVKGLIGARVPWPSTMFSTMTHHSSVVSLHKLLVSAPYGEAPPLLPEPKDEGTVITYGTGGSISIGRVDSVEGDVLVIGNRDCLIVNGQRIPQGSGKKLAITNDKDGNTLVNGLLISEPRDDEDELDLSAPTPLLLTAYQKLTHEKKAKILANPSFRACMTAHILDELDAEIVRDATTSATRAPVR